MNIESSGTQTKSNQGRVEILFHLEAQHHLKCKRHRAKLFSEAKLGQMNHATIKSSHTYLIGNQVLQSDDRLREHFTKFSNVTIFKIVIERMVNSESISNSDQKCDFCFAIISSIITNFDIFQISSCSFSQRQNTIDNPLIYPNHTIDP